MTRRIPDPDEQPIRRPLIVDQPPRPVIAWLAVAAIVVVAVVVIVWWLA